MKSKNLNCVVGDLLSIPPLIRRGINRKVVKAAFDKIGEGISVPHFEIMLTLQEGGRQHIAEIGEKLLIPKPQMTLLINRLVGLQIVERQMDENDRRLIIVDLTDRGRAILKEKDRDLRADFKKKLSGLTDEQLEELSVSLRKLRDILSII